MKEQVERVDNKFSDVHPQMQNYIAGFFLHQNTFGRAISELIRRSPLDH